MYRFIFLLLCSIQVFGQNTPAKYALLIQNTTFDDKQSWTALDSQKGNLARMKELLLEQEFKSENILTSANLNARNTRAAFSKLIEKIRTGNPKNAVVVVYLSSKGERIKDNNGDEKQHENDGSDEVFICTDSPSIDTIEKNTKKHKNGFDYYPNALIDDEIGVFNDSINTLIGANGHYLFLADLCKSADFSGGGGGLSKGNEASAFPQTKDFFLEHSNSLTKTDAKGTFISILGTNTFLRVPRKLPNEIGHFVNAFDYALHNFRSKPTYDEFFSAFREKLIGEEKQLNGGRPDMFQNRAGDKQKLFFNGAWKFQLISYTRATLSNMLSTGEKGTGSLNRASTYSFKVLNTSPYLIGEYVDIYEANIIKSSGIVSAIAEDILSVSLHTSFAPSEDKEYEIRRSEKHFNAREALRKVNKKTELNTVLRTLSDPTCKIDIETCINQYTETLVNGEKQKTVQNNCTTFSSPSFKNRKVTTTDNISVKVNLPPNKSLYYTLVDVTPTNGVMHCYVDASTNQPSGFYKEHLTTLNQVEEKNIFRSHFTEPFDELSSLWVLVSNTPITDKQFITYFINNPITEPASKKIDEAQKHELWNMLKHICFFEEINYTVIPK